MRYQDSVQKKRSGEACQGSPRQTPLRKRVMNPPLSEIENRSSRISGLSSRKELSKEMRHSVVVSERKKILRSASRRSMYSLTNTTGARKRQAITSAISKPSKICKLTKNITADKSIKKIGNLVSQTKPLEKKCKITTKSPKVLLTSHVKSKDSIQSRSSQRLLQTKGKKALECTPLRNSRMLRRHQLRKSMISAIKKSNQSKKYSSEEERSDSSVEESVDSSDDEKIPIQSSQRLLQTKEKKAPKCIPLRNTRMLRKHELRKSMNSARKKTNQTNKYSSEEETTDESVAESAASSDDENTPKILHKSLRRHLETSKLESERGNKNIQGKRGLLLTHQKRVDSKTNEKKLEATCTRYNKKDEKGESQKQKLRRSEKTKHEKLKEKHVHTKSKESRTLSSENVDTKQTYKKQQNFPDISKKPHTSNKKIVHNGFTKVLRSDIDSKCGSNSKTHNGVLKSLNNTLNERNSVSVVLTKSAPKLETTKSERTSNRHSVTRNSQTLNGDLPIAGHFQPKCHVTSSAMTRSQTSNKLHNTRNKSSKKLLDFSSSSEETILNTFLQGDEECQSIDDISISNVTSRSNCSEDSKKENLSLNISSTSSSSSKIYGTRSCHKRLRIDSQSLGRAHVLKTKT